MKAEERIQEAINNYEEELDLSYYGLYEIPKILYQDGHISKFKKLNLSNNHLSSLPKEFASMEGLQELNLSNNEFCAIPECLKELNLEKLCIGNSVSVIPEWLYKKDYGQLAIYFDKSIEVKHQIEGGFPEDILNMNKLRSLEFYWYPITELPSQIITMQNLEELALVYSDLSALPYELLQLKKLKGLNFYGCEFTQIPDFIEGMKQLRVLGFGHNLKELPCWITKFNLEELYLRFDNDVKFENIPQSILNMKMLKNLWFINGKMEFIQPEISSMHSLEEVCLDSNNIKKIPNELFELRKLKKLFLSQNKLEVIPEEIEHLNSLELLDLSSNRIKRVPDKLFSLDKLKAVYINDNEITDDKATHSKDFEDEILSIFDNLQGDI